LLLDASENNIKEHVERKAGVKSFIVRDDGRVEVVFDAIVTTPEDVRACIEDLGYTASIATDSGERIAILSHDTQFHSENPLLRLNF